jgi:hypothetical protein
MVVRKNNLHLFPGRFLVESLFSDYSCQRYRMTTREPDSFEQFNVRQSMGIKANLWKVMYEAQDPNLITCVAAFSQACAAQHVGVAEITDTSNPGERGSRQSLARFLRCLAHCR